MQTLLFKQVDVFTQKPFLGNQVAVVIEAEGLQRRRFASSARLNSSEVSFAGTRKTAH
jgi:predicted PhzF superfamily epimerase YddE/YHI9